MSRLLRRLKFNLKAAGMTVWLFCYYVDDVRLVVRPLPQGWMWKKAQHQSNLWTMGVKGELNPGGDGQEVRGEFSYQEEWALEDIDSDLPDL